jgi:hypothetical protein
MGSQAMMKRPFAILLFAFALATLALAYLVRPHPVNEARGATDFAERWYPYQLPGNNR